MGKLQTRYKHQVQDAEPGKRIYSTFLSDADFFALKLRTLTNILERREERIKKQRSCRMN